MKKAALKKLVEAFDELDGGISDVLFAVLLGHWITEGVDQDIIWKLCEVADLRDQREQAKAGQLTAVQ